ncbi:tRNA 2-selenouridine(34) synthase MnmH [Pontibaca salina]|uniref:tRNA 2-selenouridine(34) synthase MnmH n=1 Tax=Pontibaca salina TaxID=2795731 RepID=A0A934HR39_9RHOB|nr:tRNA 2-selenouridine(34) synthase MnmH [Pontibaca salina]MBI6628658.1 tRNA 2-selenouridine(34) synthase MnmH [Pontibaca salina]
MKQEFPTLAALLHHGFDAVIDVRSSAEYAEDHLPGAINLPVLSNEERARVGTIYKQQSPFLARKIGGALVFRNAADHIETTLHGYDGGWRPLVYCWRGGQRSGAFAWMLEQIGWRAGLLSGGYRTYRRLVKAYLYDTVLPHRFIALDGYTGTAKTTLLHLLEARGVQMIDLEGLANHRGSLLGAYEGGQPSQKGLETKLALALSALDPARPVLIEAESNRIGARFIPPSLWNAMKSAPRIQISAPIKARAAFLVQEYDDILSDAPRLKAKLDRLRPYRGHAVVDEWFTLIDAGERRALTRALMEQHYDPSYAKSCHKGAQFLARIEADHLDAAGLETAAAQIEGLLTQVNPGQA